MWVEWPPFVFLLAGAVLALVLPGRAAAVISLIAPVLGFVQVVSLTEGTEWTIRLLGLELLPGRVDRLSLLFGYLFHIAAFLGAVYSWHVRDRVQQVASLGYAASAVGVVFAGDMLSLFVAWELMAVTSVFLIWARRTRASVGAGLRYVILQGLSGLVLLAGVLMRYGETGTLEVGPIGLEGGELFAWLILAGVGIKAAFPGAHVWLTDGYPNATPTGSVWLSAFTTKVAVYVLARGYAGTEVLVVLGAVMAAFPIFYAVIENDLRRVLGYSMINQVGFMVVGVGIGTELAVNGAVAHAFNDVLFKGLLFMSMGAVLHATGRIGGASLGGLAKKMPWTATCCVVGAASISAFPLFSGFVSKSMVMAAALEEHHEIVWLVLLFASAGVFHHAGIKIPYFAFFAPARGETDSVREAPWNMRIAMGAAALLCIAIGVAPRSLYALLPYATDYSAYDATHVLTQTQILFFSALAFAWLQWTKLYPPEIPSTNLDADWLWRVPGLRAYRLVRAGVARVAGGVRGGSHEALGGVLRGLKRSHGPHGLLARSWPTASVMVWVTVLLSGYLLLYFARI
jgi:multicomponent Na+:H+ antiporter subunit D